MTALSLLAFAGLCLLLSVTPGPDTFLVLRTALSRPGAGIATAAGSASAALAWAALVGVGLAAIVEESAEVFRWIKIAGGIYLLYLGISSFLKTRKAAAAAVLEESDPSDATILPSAAGKPTGVDALKPAPRGRLAGFGSGALSTLLNPKVGLFYLAVVPQFIPHGGNTLGTAMILGCIEAVIGFCYLAVVALIAYKAMTWLRRPKVNTTMERASSGILAALGVGILASGAAG